MTDTIPEDIQAEVKNELAEIGLTSRTTFPIKYFAKKSPATRKLIERSDGTVEMRADKRWYSAYFEEPQVISVIRVYHKELTKHPKFNFTFKRHYDGKAIRVSADNISHHKTKEDRDFIEVKIFQLVEDISFEPPRSWKKGRAVTGIDIFGYDRENFEKTVEDTLNVFALKSETERKFDALVKEANETISNAGALSEEITVLGQKKTELTDSLSLLREELQSLNQKHSQVESDITVRTEVFKKKKMI